MYILIWVAFAEILIGVTPALYFLVLYGIHPLLGLAVLVLAYLVYSQVKATSCPDRIKRITKTTFVLGVFQGVLGAVLFAAVFMQLWAGVIEIIGFLHVVNALAIITQASSSATAFDMWEEKEFLTSQAPAGTV